MHRLVFGKASLWKHTELWAKKLSTGLGRPKTLSWKQKQKHSLNSLTPTWPQHGSISWNIASAGYKQVLHRRGFYGQICLGNTGLKFYRFLVCRASQAFNMLSCFRRLRRGYNMEYFSYTFHAILQKIVTEFQMYFSSLIYLFMMGIQWRVVKKILLCIFQRSNLQKQVLERFCSWNLK